VAESGNHKPVTKGGPWQDRNLEEKASLGRQRQWGHAAELILAPRDWAKKNISFVFGTNFPERMAWLGSIGNLRQKIPQERTQGLKIRIKNGSSYISASGMASVCWQRNFLMWTNLNSCFRKPRGPIPGQENRIVPGLLLRKSTISRARLPSTS